MSMITQLFSLLNGATDAGGKVYPMVAPDQTRAPFITYQRISWVSEDVLDGSNVDLVNTRLQIDIFAPTYLKAASISEKVETLMMGGFAQIVSIQSQETYEAAVDLYRVIAEYSIWHKP